MDTLFSMKVFKKIIETGSFVSASEKLDISTAMTSKHIKHLEDYLGVRLINRTSRKISLTEEGQIYYDSCHDILNELEETEAALKCKSVIPRGILKITVPLWFNTKFFSDAIKEYQKLYPEVIIDINMSDRIVDLVEEGIDLALRVTVEPHSTLIARRICPIKFNIVAENKYIKDTGKPITPSDLTKHKYIANSNTNNMKNNISLTDKNGQNTIVELTPFIYVNNTAMIAQTVVSGGGIALLPEILINEEYYSDKLQKVLPDYQINFLPYLYALYSTRRYLSPRVRTFIDFIVEWFKNTLLGSKINYE